MQHLCGYDLSVNCHCSTDDTVQVLLTLTIIYAEQQPTADKQNGYHQ